MELRQRKKDEKSSQTGHFIDGSQVKPSSSLFGSSHAMRFVRVFSLFVSISAVAIVVFLFKNEPKLKSVIRTKIVPKAVKIIARSNNMFDTDKRLIKKRCQDGTNHTCKCTFNTNKRRLWYDSHENLIKEIQIAIKSDASSDIVFLGDSITESFSGRWIIFERDLKDISGVFNTYFRKNVTGRYLNGLPLGIAGDRTVDLLWRIKNGEMPLELNPKIWWILIGTNDIGRDRNCSEELTVQGILKIVQEIQNRKGSNATIVVNSILPRSTRSEKGLLSRHWTMIQRMNIELYTIFNKIENIYFFNASNLFINISNDNGKYFIPKKLMPDFLHPSKEGYIVWSEEIVKWIGENNLINNLQAVSR